MAYEQKANAGNLWQNKHRKTENHPFWRGSVFIDKVLLEDLINKSKGSLVEVAISGWNKKTKDDEAYVSLQASEPYKKQEQASSTDGDLPEFMR